MPSIEDTALGRARNDAVQAATSAVLAGGTEDQMEQLEEALRLRRATLLREAEANGSDGATRANEEEQGELM